MIDKAIHFAVEAHKNQVRKGTGLPYIVHPLDVLSQIGQWRIQDELAWKVAVLHDTMEDCPSVTHDVLKEVFDAITADMVEELTFEEDKGSRKSKKQQKQEYMDSFGHKSIVAFVVKVADRLCNVRDFMTNEDDYVSEYFKKASSLFQLVDSRKGTIDNLFGPKVQPLIKLSIRELVESSTLSFSAHAS